MIKELCGAAHGWYVWRHLKKKYHIDEQTAVIILPEDDTEWNRTALLYLSDYLKRKNAYRAVILITDKAKRSLETQTLEDGPSEFVAIDQDSTYRLMDFYCLHRFFDKIVFFYLDHPRDNRSSYILKTTDVTPDELVCLSFYRLREVPVHV